MAGGVRLIGRQRDGREFSLNNSNNISPTPTITNVAPTTAGDNTAWTVTVYSTGSNSGILGLIYQGTASEVPAVTPQFIGYSYQYDSGLSVQPYFSQVPPATLNVNVNTTPPALVAVANVRSGGTIHYDWYRGTSVSSGTRVVSDGSGTYQPPASSTSGTVQYFCHAYDTYSTGNTHTVDSPTTTINFNTAVQITAQPVSYNLLPDSQVALSVTVTGSSPTVQWYFGAPGDTSQPISGATSTTLQTGYLANTTRYWARVSNAYNSVDSQGATVLIASSLTLADPTISVPVGQTFRSVLTATDSAGRPVPGITVNFQVPSIATFGGTVYNSQTINGSGVATSAAITALSAGSGTVYVYLLDALSDLRSRTMGLTVTTPTAPTIVNPSFELDHYTVSPGYASGNGNAITGWSDSGNVGMNPAGGSPFADNGAVPDGSNVAFVQSTGSASSLSTTILGLVAGQSCTLNFSYNSRSNSAGQPVPTVSINGGLAVSVPVTGLPVGGTNPYKTFSSAFTATGSTAALTITNTTSADSTLLVDNFLVTASPVITSAMPSSPVTVGTPYTHTFTAAGTGPFTFSKTAGTLPPGLTLSSAGVLSGTPTAVGTGTHSGIVVRVFGGAPSNSSQSFSLSITTTAANYLAGYGLTGANAAPTADPNGDGA